MNATTLMEGGGGFRCPCQVSGVTRPLSLSSERCVDELLQTATSSTPNVSMLCNWVQVAMVDSDRPNHDGSCGMLLNSELMHLELDGMEAQLAFGRSTQVQWV